MMITYEKESGTYLSECGRAMTAQEVVEFARELHNANIVEEEHPRDIRVLFLAATPRELLENYRVVDLDDEAIYNLAAAHGFDNKLYRADYMSGCDIFRPEPIREIDACLAYLNRDEK